MGEVLTLRALIFIQPQAVQNSSLVGSHHSATEGRNITKQEGVSVAQKQAIKVKHTETYTIISKCQCLGAGLTHTKPT